MTHPATSDQSAPAADAAAAPDAAPPTGVAAPAESTDAPEASEAESTEATEAAPPRARGERAQKRPPSRTAIQPVLEQLAALYPQLFGAVFRPLKRGIFQDLLAAHPAVFERESLKDALGFHTRSTRYLTAVAAGQRRHDLQGRPVEAMAPEHVHHALLEVFRRRQGRGGEDLRPRLRDRIVQAWEASGLSREDYVTLVRGRDEAANALLDEAMAIVGERNARDEALLRAFESSGAAMEAFAEMYGLDPNTAARSLERARRLRPA